MPPAILNRLRLALVLLAAVWLAVGCGSVDLGPRYDPPPIRMPEPLPPQPAAQSDPSGSVGPVAQSQAIPAPAQPVGQPLPPIVAPRPPGPSPASQVNLVALTARLDGTSVIPPARSGASGQLDAAYDSATRVLRWKASWSGLMGVITGVQFHGPADPAQNAPATMLWPGPFGPTYEGRATLTPQQVADLLGGRWYVSVFTSMYSLGELRGQLRVVN